MRTKLLDANQPGAIEEAAEFLRRGYLIAFPTDTVYGIGASIQKPAAITHLYRAKNRPQEKGIPILLSDDKNLLQVAREISPLAQRLIDRFWPGPLTLILPRQVHLPSALSPTDSIAVRIPASDVARRLIQAAGGAIAASSANRSGRSPALRAKEALESVGDELAAVLDGGPVKYSIASTVVEITDNRWRILRKGPVTANEIMLASTGDV